MRSTREILNYARDFLSTSNVDSPRVEGEWLVSHVLGLSRSELMINSEKIVEPEAVRTLEMLLSRRKRGVPLQYIIGSTDFYNSEILVGPGVFIPRPETELLVQITLAHYNNSGDILDLCTGSGAILFALSNELSRSHLLMGIDNSLDALHWAELNLNRLGDSKVQFLHGDLFSPVQGRQFEIITANPPYVSSVEFKELPLGIQEYEPTQALLADDNGLAVLTRIVQSAQSHLVDRGWLICEIGETQGDRIRKVFARNSWRNVQIFQDYTRRDRIVIGQK